MLLDRARWPAVMTCLALVLGLGSCASVPEDGMRAREAAQGSSPQRSFDQCFARCQALTQRTREQCFDACKER